MQTEPFIRWHVPPSSRHLPLTYGEVMEYPARKRTRVPLATILLCALCLALALAPH